MKAVLWRWRAKGWDRWIVVDNEPDLDRDYYEVQALWC